MAKIRLSPHHKARTPDNRLFLQDRGRRLRLNGKGKKLIDPQSIKKIRPKVTIRRK